MLRSGPGPQRAACFHGSSLVRLADGTTQRIDQVSTGDLVASVNDHGEATIAEVVYVPHLTNDISVPFLQLSCRELDEGQLSTMLVTSEHFVFRSKSTIGFAQAVAVPANEVVPGDWLWRMTSSDSHDGTHTGPGPCQVIEDAATLRGLEGVYTLFTDNGKFVVDGLVVSSYAGSESRYYGHTVAHEAMFLHRFVHRLGHSSRAWFRYLNEYLLEPLVSSAV